MRKLAYFSPLPPTPSGISDYSWDLLPFLAQSAEITLFHNFPEQLPKRILPVRSIAAFEETHWQFELPIYHIGNSKWHAEIYEALRKHPGITVLHDYVTHSTGDFAIRERDIHYVNLVIPSLQIPTNHALVNPFKHSLNQRILDLSLGLIVHSNHVAGLVRKSHPELPIQVVSMPIVQTAPAPTPRDPDRTIRFGSIGQITPSRQLEMALVAFGRIHQTHPTSEYHIIGAFAHEDSASAKAALLAEMPETARSAVHWHGHIESLDEFEQLTRSLDLLVNLRHPSAGETSASALRALGQGVPVIVFDHAWYSELPDSCALKIPLMDEDALLAAMHEGLARREQMATAAHTYIAKHHHPSRTASAYLSFVEQVIRSYW